MRPLPLAITALSVLLACARAEEPGEQTRELGSDTLSFGSNVSLSEPAKGDVLAAGENVGISARVPGDTLVAGAALDLTGPFEADVYAAGGRVHLDGAVGGSLRAAGGAVKLGPATDVRGGVSIASGEADIQGKLQDYLQIASGTTRLGARVAGDVDVSGSSLEIGPSAEIQGSLTFHGPEGLVISPLARIHGEVHHLAPPPAPAWWTRSSGLLWTLGLALIGALALAFSPELSRSLIQVARTQTARASLVGIGILLGAPLAVLIAFLSVLGAPLGLVTLAGYVLCLPLGYVVSGMALSDGLWRRWGPTDDPRTGHRLFLLTIVLVLLGGLSSLPVLGWVLILLLISVGLGSVAIHVSRKLRGSGPGEPHPPTPQPPDGVPEAQTG